MAETFSFSNPLAKKYFRSIVQHMSNEKHPHAAALDRLGFEPIQSHFNITRRNWNYWRERGVPDLHRNTILMLAKIKGVSVPELRATAARAPKGAVA